VPQILISTYKNTLLKALGTDVIQRLCLHPVTFELKHEIEFPGNPLEHLFFVEEGMASMTATFEDGSQVEIGMFGYESVIGVSALMGTKRSLNRVYTQIPGNGYSCPVETARREFNLVGAFHALTLRYVQAQLIQAAQSAACNAKHNIEQRLARWLLLCADRAHSDTFHLSQTFLADMLGSSRPTVTLAAGPLKEEGLIEYSRGVIRILDIAGLEKKACECYHVIKDHLDNYAEFDSGITA
jgi:CRP-like cAMP-binding protein